MLTRDKNFYKLILSISLPIACQNIITFSVSMADSIMVGKLGENPFVAVSLANQLFFIFMILIFGLGSGANILVSQYWGKKDVHAIHKVTSIIYKISIIFSVLFMLIATLIPEVFMRIFSDNLEVIDLGCQYLRVIFISYIFFAVTNITMTILRSVETVNISLLVYGTSLVVNVFFNWVFIYGNLGAPALGVRGAALATTIARIVEFIIALGFMLFFEKKIKFKARYLLKTDKTLLKDFIVIGGPVVFNELIWVLGSSAIVYIISKMGEEVVAANNISNVVWQFVSVFIMGVGHAGAVIIGNTIGQEQYNKVQEYANTLVVISILLGIIGGLVMFFIRPYILHFYNLTELTKQITLQVMGANSFIILFQSLAFILMVGVLRGGGDTTFVLIADLVFLLLIAVPFGYLVAVILKWPIPLAVIVLKCDEIIKVFASLLRLKSGKWMRNVTR